MNNQVFTKFIESEIAIAIYNDDMSGLSDKVIDKVEQFMENTLLIIPENCDYQYTWCAITGKASECIGCLISKK